MGKREVHICDCCKADLPFDGMFPSFQAADVQIKLYKKAWGDPEYVVGWKGELCAECVAIINRTAETFYREMSARAKKPAPGEHLSSADAKTPVARKKKR